MKPYLPYAVTAVLVIVGLAAAFFITPVMQSPQAKLNEKIEGELTKAEAMLAGYDPSDAVFDRMLAEPTTQPIEGASSEFRDELKKRSALVKDALATVSAAVNERVGEGENEASGSSHLAATRLEAILSYVQANLLRQQAAVYRSITDQNRARFSDWMRQWAAYDAQARGMQAQLNQRTAGEIVTEQATAPADAAPAPAAPKPKLDAPQKATSGGGLFSSVLGKLPKGAAQPPAPKPAPKPAAPAPAPAVAEAKPETQPAEVAALPALEAACPAWADTQDLQLRAGQTFAGAIADLKVCREQVEASLAEARQKAGAIEPTIKALQAKLAAAEELAKSSQKRMLELEHAGVDASDPNSLPRYTEAYNAASQQLRKASLEATILKYGHADAKLTDEEKELLTEPPVAVDKAVTQEERGLQAYTSDMAALQGLIATRDNLLKALDTQIARLTEREKQVQTQLARVDAVRGAAAKEALAAAQAATAAALEADRLENEALNLANGPGRAAAQRAERAASDWVAKGQDLNSQYPEAQNPRFQMMMGDAPLVGHAKSLTADMDYMIARIQAQRVRGLEAQAGLLESIQRMGLQGQAALPADAKPEGSEWAADAKAAAKTAEAARAEGVKAGEAALEKYRSADNDVKRIWPLHAQIAAVHYLLRNMTSGADAAKHCTEARREYEMALRDRRDQPLARQYQRVVDELAATCK